MNVTRNLIIAGIVLILASCCFGSGVATGMWVMYQKIMTELQTPSNAQPRGAIETPTTPPALEPIPGPPSPPVQRDEHVSLSHLSPSWMVLPERPSELEQRAYESMALAGRDASFTATRTQRAVHVREERRFYDARDRILARPTPYGLWAWPQVRQALVDIGSLSLPLLESVPAEEPRGCIAFYQTGIEQLAFCAAGVTKLTDTDLEASVVHEATHVALVRMIQERSGYSAREFSYLTSSCSDVAEEFLFTTEGIAFLNQAAYLDGRSTEALSQLLHTDVMQSTAWWALTQPARESEWPFAQNLIWYTNQPAENPYLGNNGRRCGQLVMVKGRYAGNYLLAMDFVPRLAHLAEFVPHFRQTPYRR